MAKNGRLNKNGEIYYPAPFWPINSIYMSMANINPSTYFGGTWILIGQGRTLVGVDTALTEFNTVGKTGGEKTHKLTVAEMPIHNHIPVTRCSSSVPGTDGGITRSNGGTVEDKWGETYTKNTGSDTPHNNLPPYITCYIWQKTA
jgi:hypothetical protein